MTLTATSPGIARRKSLGKRQALWVTPSQERRSVLTSFHHPQIYSERELCFILKFTLQQMNALPPGIFCLRLQRGLLNEQKQRSQCRKQELPASPAIVQNSFLRPRSIGTSLIGP